MKTKFFSTALASLLLANSISSCSDDNSDEEVVKESETVSTNSYSTADIIEEEDLNAQEYADKYLSGDKEAKQKFLKNAKIKADSVANERGENGVCTMYHTVKYNYWSVDENNSPIQLSAFMSWGYFSLGFASWEMKQNKVILYCPYTRTLGSECSTKSNGGLETYTFMCDNLVIMPDYEGFGTSQNRLQVYLNHELMAKQNYDALVHGEQIFASKGGKYESDYYMVIAGCSQGGGNAIALQKYMENTKDSNGKTLADNQKFKYVMAACGPYSPETTWKEYLNWGKIAYPCALPLVIKSMMISYPEEFKGIDETRFYSDAYNEHKDEFDNIYLNKTKNTDQINSRMMELFGSSQEKKEGKMNLSTILSEEALNLDSEIMQKLIKCLRKNDLTTGWYPTHKIYLYQCTGDEVVPYANSAKLASAFASKMDITTWSSALSHTQCCGLFIALKW